jgi:class I fructose-bisphosphate aldolase
MVSPARPLDAAETVIPRSPKESVMASATASNVDRIAELLGDNADSLLNHKSTTIDQSLLHLPGPDFIERVMLDTDRSNTTLRNLRETYNHGRLAGTGYVSILPVDQGIEHSAAASFAPNPIYFDPAAIVELAIEGGCNAVASTIGVLGATARKYAHRIPYIVKLNHNELLTYPNQFDQVPFGSVKRAWEMGAAGVGATIYFGSDQSTRQIREISAAFEEAHSYGMYTVLWCYLRNSAFKKDGVDYHLSADLTGQANHLGVTIEADIIKQKLPENNNGYGAMNQNGGSYGRTSPLVYSELTTDHPIDLCRYQVANCYMGRAGLINSGGASSGDTDLAEVVTTAVINKRAGGTGLITGRKAFQRPMKDGVEILNAVQDVYLNDDVTIA